MANCVACGCYTPEGRDLCPLCEDDEVDTGVHYLKLSYDYFYAVQTGVKPFEVRKDDRGFCLWDICVFCETKDGEYTGRTFSARISYILRDPEYVKEGFCILGLQNVM